MCYGHLETRQNRQPAAGRSYVCSNRPVSEWRQYWLVQIRRAVPGGWPKTEVHEVRADTAAELRDLVEHARADPGVLAFPYEARRELVGPEPTVCRRGHRYGSSWRDVRTEWLACRYGGHMVYVCRTNVDGSECGAQQIDPYATHDCDVIWPRSQHD
jgi:hypothetical protein